MTVHLTCWVTCKSKNQTSTMHTQYSLSIGKEEETMTMSRLILQTAAMFSTAHPYPWVRIRSTCIRSRQWSAQADQNKNNANDSFEILGLERSFSVDPATLKQRYRTLMTDFHPDKHTLKDAGEQDSFERLAAAVTLAYDTLKNPHTRATHLLEVLGRPMEEGSTGELVGNEFLMEIMEVRETLDSTTGDDALRPLLLDNQKRIEETSALLAQAFDIDPPDLERALKLTARLQYWNRIDETLREKMKSLH
jgi:molecular chaperone HscB